MAHGCDDHTKLDACHILWNDPATGFFAQQIGRRHGGDIVQTGADPRGGSARWIFSDIASDSFHWRAEHKAADADWRREVDIVAYGA